MRCMGRFFVGEKFLMNDQHGAARIFQGMVVLQADHRYDRMGTEYLATGEMFDEIPEGEMAPLYDVVVDEADGSVQFLREREDGQAGTNAPRG